MRFTRLVFFVFFWDSRNGLKSVTLQANRCKRLRRRRNDDEGGWELLRCGCGRRLGRLSWSLRRNVWLWDRGIKLLRLGCWLLSDLLLRLSNCEWWSNVDIPVVFIGLTLVDIPVSHKVAFLLRVPLFVFIVFVCFLFLATLH